jgi:hypothetical protein
MKSGWDGQVWVGFVWIEFVVNIEGYGIIAI